MDYPDDDYPDQWAAVEAKLTQAQSLVASAASDLRGLDLDLAREVQRYREGLCEVRNQIADGLSQRHVAPRA